MDRDRGDGMGILAGTCENPDASPWRDAEGGLIIGFGGFAIARGSQFSFGSGMIAIAIIGYFCAFPELAVLLGSFVASLLFVSPFFVAAYLALRFLLRNQGLVKPRI